ncbi:Hypothetical predicted protein, partial [Podarcis lilfordi]
READEPRNDAPVPSKAGKDRREVASPKPPGSAAQAAEEAAAAAGKRAVVEGAPPQRRPRPERAPPRSGPSKSREALGAPHSRATGEAAAAWLSAPGAFYILQYDSTGEGERQRQRDPGWGFRSAAPGAGGRGMPISAPALDGG